VPEIVGFIAGITALGWQISYGISKYFDIVGFIDR
jgi:hypothetical protein